MEPKNLSVKMIDPIKLAETQQQLSGLLPLTNFLQLKPSLEEIDNQQVKYDLQFDQDEQGLVIIKGRINATLPLLCQRCLHPFHYPLTGEMTLCPVTSDSEAKQLPDVYDPIMMQEGMLNIKDIIEEELLLQLPLIPVHLDTECMVQFVAENEEPDVKKPNPFASLAALKKD